MNRFQTTVAAITVIILLAIGGWVLFKPDDEKSVTIAQPVEFFLYMPLYFAKDEGYFERSGITVDFLNTGGDDKSFAAVVSGAAQFGVGDPSFTAIAAQEGKRGFVVGGIVNGVPFWGVAKDPSVPVITRPEQLDGYRVATFPSPSTAYVLQEAMFKSGGIEPNIQEAAFGGLLPLLEARTVDIALELEPNVSTAVNSGARVVYGMPQIYGDFAITGITVTEEYFNDNGEMIRKLLTALNSAMEDMHADAGRLKQYAIRRFPNLEPTVVEKAIDRLLATETLPRSTSVTDAAWRKALELREQVGQLSDVEISMSLLKQPLNP